MKIFLLLALAAHPGAAQAAKNGFTVQNMNSLAKQVAPILSNCEDLKLDDPVKALPLKNSTSEHLNKKALLAALKENFEKVMKFSDDSKIELRSKVSSSETEKNRLRTVIYRLDAELWVAGKKRCEANGELMKKIPR